MKSKILTLGSKINFITGSFMILSFTVIITFSSIFFFTYYSRLMREKIDESVLYNITEINRLTGIMEKRASDLAAFASEIHDIKKQSVNINYEKVFSEYLINTFTHTPEAIGGGIWFDRYAFINNNPYYGPYVFWNSDNKVEFTWDLSASEYDYLNQDWFKFALPENHNRNLKRPKNYYWTAPYIDEAGSGALMITVDAFIYDKKNRIIGITTVDWELEAMIKTLSESRISPHSESFLIDRENNIIITYTKDISYTMKNSSLFDWYSNISPDRNGIKFIDDGERIIYYTYTNSGMLYGAEVPKSDLSGSIISLVTNNIIIAFILLLIIILAIRLFLNKALSPVSSIAEHFRTVATGDLSSNLNFKSRDEIGNISDSFNLIENNFRTIINDIKEASAVNRESGSAIMEYSAISVDELNYINTDITSINKNAAALDNDAVNSLTLSKHFKDFMQNLTAMIGEQAASIEQSSSSINQMAASIRSLAEISESRLNMVNNLKNIASDGERAMEQSIDTIKKVSSSAEIISELLSVITNIASQTDLLAMNAAIEAAHAGDAGKGFSVVADEIRNLAENTANNSKEIEHSLRTVMENITLSETNTQNTGEIFRNIINGINDVGNSFMEMKSAMYELSIGSNQVIDALESIVRITTSVQNSTGEVNDKINSISTAVQNVSTISSTTRSEVGNITERLSKLFKNIETISRIGRENVEIIKKLESLAGKFKT